MRATPPITPPTIAPMLGPDVALWAVPGSPVEVGLGNGGCDVGVTVASETKMGSSAHNE